MSICSVHFTQTASMDLVTHQSGLNTSRGLAHFVPKRFGVHPHVHGVLHYCLLVLVELLSIDQLHALSQAIDEKGVRVIVNRLGHYIPAVRPHAPPVCGCSTGASCAGLNL